MGPARECGAECTTDITRSQRTAVVPRSDRNAGNISRRHVSHRPGLPAIAPIAARRGGAMPSTKCRAAACGHDFGDVLACTVAADAAASCFLGRNKCRDHPPTALREVQVRALTEPRPRAAIRSRKKRNARALQLKLTYVTRWDGARRVDAAALRAPRPHSPTNPHQRHQHSTRTRSGRITGPSD